MRKLILLLLACTVFTSYGQNIKNEGIRVKYLQLPATPLSKNYKTYSQKIELYTLSPEDSRDGLTNSLRNASSIKGYEAKDNGGDFVVYTKLDPFVIRNVQTKNEERSETRQDKTVVKYTVYFRTYEYAYPLRYTLKDAKKDSIIAEEYVAGSQDMQAGRTDEYRTFDQLKAAWERKPAEVKNSALNSGLSAMSSQLTDRYSFVPTNKFWQINYVETKKVNYDDVVAAKDATQKALLALSDASAEISDESKAEVIKVIDMWKNILKESNPEDKKARIDRKVTVAIMENIAYCYFFINDFTNASGTAQQSRSIDKQAWNLVLESDIKEKKTRLAANGVAFN